MADKKLTHSSSPIGLLAAVALMAAVVAAMAAACASPAAASDPRLVIQSFHSAVNSKNVDAAMALVADDAVFSNIQPSGVTFTGKTQIRGFVQSMVDQDIQVQPGSLKVSGATVNYDGAVIQGGVQTATRHIEVVVQNGQITSYSNK